MSGYNHSDAFDADELDGQQTGGGLRKQLEDALAANKKLSERLDKIERQAPVEALLKEKGIDPAVSAMIPENADPEKWVEQYGKFLGAKVQEQSREGDLEQEQEPEVPPVDAALEQERQAMETLQEYGPGTGIPSTASQDQIAKLKSFDNEADLLAYIQSGGVT